MLSRGVVRARPAASRVKYYIQRPVTVPAVVREIVARSVLVRFPSPVVKAGGVDTSGVSTSVSNS